MMGTKRGVFSGAGRVNLMLLLILLGVFSVAAFAGITIAVALIAGYVTGKILSIFGRRIEPYVDSEEFVLE
jgi:hypothetical protein